MRAFKGSHLTRAFTGFYRMRALKALTTLGLDWLTDQLAGCLGRMPCLLAGRAETVTTVAPLIVNATAGWLACWLAVADWLAG